jgi:hypothetical protein
MAPPGRQRRGGAEAIAAVAAAETTTDGSGSTPYRGRGKIVRASGYKKHMEQTPTEIAKKLPNANAVIVY